MASNITLRVFEEGDAQAVVDVLRSSIQYCYAQDYAYCSEKSLQDWLENKTTENISKWMYAPELANVLALVNNKIAGVGMINIETGHLGLCYVHPSFMGKGIGQSLLICLEEFALKSNCPKIHFTSSAGAQKFYEKWGAIVTGEEAGMSGEAINPIMEKPLGEKLKDVS